MTKICDLLGSRSEVLYACMYTKHKTQKRKIWHDGFVMLHASKKLVVYADDEGKAGKVLDEAKLSSIEWDSKDEEHVETSKFLVEIVNESPVLCTQTAIRNEASESINKAPQASSNRTVDHLKGPRAGREGRMRLFNTTFRTPLHHPDPSRQTRPHRVAQPYNRKVAATSDGSTPRALKLSLDFARHPTSEWNYVPNAINRTRRILHNFSNGKNDGEMY